MFKNISLRIRIFLAMILLVLLASVLILGVTVYQYDEQTKEYNISRFSRKENSVISSIEFELKRENREPLSTETLGKIFQNRIYEIASTHKLNISIFDLEGNLIITSNTINSFDTRKEDQALSSQVIEDLEDLPSHRVFSNVVIDNISNETSYTYLTDLKFKRIGVLELKFSQDNSEEQKELEEFITRLTYVYLLMFLIAIALAYFLSSYITRSIKTISDKIHVTRLNKRNEKIEFNSGSTEIITLVNAYNRMIDELQESAVKLAQSEREQAWREMAKQVAHEIKNPLTPMKLTIQHLQRVVETNPDDINERVNKVSHMLIEQIDTLSHIATEFSNFAKLPSTNLEAVNLSDVLQNVTDLFQQNTKCEITLVAEPDLLMQADKDQCVRVFTNLLKNAEQSIPESRVGKIEVKAYVENNMIVVKIKDNGCGIAQELQHKLFTPNFTTKTTGTGLGLAMVKNSVLSFNGTITFETDINFGTTFTLTFPSGAK